VNLGPTTATDLDNWQQLAVERIYAEEVEYWEESPQLTFIRCVYGHLVPNNGVFALFLISLLQGGTGIKEKDQGLISFFSGLWGGGGVRGGAGTNYVINNSNTNQVQVTLLVKVSQGHNYQIATNKTCMVHEVLFLQIAHASGQTTANKLSMGHRVLFLQQIVHVSRETGTNKLHQEKKKYM